VQRRGCFCFLDETTLERRLRGKVRRQDLKRDKTVEPLVARSVNGAHATVAKFLKNAVVRDGAAVKIISRFIPRERGTFYNIAKLARKACRVVLFKQALNLTTQVRVFDSRQQLVAFTRFQTNRPLKQCAYLSPARFDGSS